MNPSSDYPDLVQTVQLEQKLQQAVEHLKEYFKLDSIPKEDGYSELGCSPDGLVALEKVRDEIKEEYFNKKIGDIVKKIIPRPGTLHYVSRKALLLVFQSGWSNFADIIGTGKCCILITMAVEGSAEATIEERSTGERVVVESSSKAAIAEQSTARRTTIKFEKDSILIISGRCSLWLQPQSKAVCVVVGAGKG